jgi:parallel beta-helix repeat protein
MKFKPKRRLRKRALCRHADSRQGGSKLSTRGVSSIIVVIVIVIIVAVGVCGYLLLKGEKKEGLTSHDPINIEGNAGFTAANGVVGGSGTVGDPYIIEGWDIKAENENVVLIDIDNTTAHFIIRNCYVHGGWGGAIYTGITNTGILFSNVINGVVENSIVENNGGIYLYNSRNNLISGNTLISNPYGIYLFGLSNNLISGNTFINDGFRVEFSYQNTVENNTVNGRPLVYLEGGSDRVITDAGQVILVGCENIIVENLNLSNASIGVELWGTDNSKVVNNTVENNSWEGIYLAFYSYNNLISNNTVKNNSWEGGIHLDSSNNNLVSGNTVENNYWHGVYLYSSDNNLVSGNTCENNYYGIYLESYSDNNLISGNTAENGHYCGIALWYGSDNNIISNNTVKNNSWEGIYLDSSNNNLIENNIVENNSQNGFYLGSSDNNIIYHNNLQNNTNQAYDNGSNYWNNGYPSGGNYWSDYTGVDNYWGENQDIPGSDGIGDTPYNILWWQQSGSLPAHNKDRYPLMNPI